MNRIGDAFNSSIERFQGVSIKIIHSWFQESMKIVSHDQSQLQSKG